MSATLPTTVQVIADVIGRDATLKLVQQIKRRYLYIPKTHLSNDHFIVQTIGRQRAAALQWHFAGELLPLANCRYVHLQKRNKEIHAAFGSGKTAKQIATSFGLSTSQVERILNPALLERVRQQNRAYMKKLRMRHRLDKARGVIGSSKAGSMRVGGTAQ